MPRTQSPILERDDKSTNKLPHLQTQGTPPFQENTFPSEIPVTIPMLDTVATDSSLLVHIPPEVGIRNVFSPSQMVEGPFKFNVGEWLTITSIDSSS